MFVGPEQPPGTAWNPDFASITGSGVEPHLGNMLLQSGVANDGTVWQRIDDAAGMGLRRQRARVRGLPESRVLGAEIEVGAPRFAWHPGWLPVGERDVVAFRAGLARPAAGAAEGAGGLVAEADGVAARDLQLSIRSCGGAAVLRPEDVAVVDGELVVTVPDGAFVRDDWLDDQAWAVEALRRLARHERAARATAAIDRDRDGRGEFGAVEDVVPQLELGSIRRLDNGRFLFRGHLFELHLPPGADAAEQGFVAYAWPARPDRPNALAFCVDARGAVRSCSARERFAGHDRAPAADAGADESLGWRSLR